MTGWSMVGTVLGSGLAATTVTLLVNGMQTIAAGRREHYAEAMRALVSWCEYPYRIRRRTSDDPATLAELAQLGHALQESLAYHATWIASDSPAVAEIYRGAQATLAGSVGVACSQAWRSGPIMSAAEMVLTPATQDDVRRVIDIVQQAVDHRFGPRRLLPGPVVRRLLSGVHGELVGLRSPSAST